MQNSQKLIRPSSEIVPADEIDIILFKKSFKEFALHCWKMMNGHRPLKWNWHHDCICDHLQAIGDGETRHTYFVVPPRHTKSTFISHYFHAWLWLRQPHLEFISAAYNSRRAETDAEKSRDIIDSDWYKSLVKALPEKDQWELTRKSPSRIANNKNGARRAVGMGRISGENADIILLDDVLSSTDVDSMAVMGTLEQWWRDTISTRFNDPNEGVFVIINQRLAERDLIGLVHETEEIADWNRVVFPIEYEKNHPDPFTTRVMNPKTKKLWYDPREDKTEEEIKNDPNALVLDPARHDHKFVATKKKRMSPSAYNAQFRGWPTGEEGTVFKKEWFTHISEKQYATLKENLTIQSWDTAFTDEKLKLEQQTGIRNSFSVCTTWSIMSPIDDPDDRYIVLRDVFYDQMEYPQLRSKAIELDEKWNPAMVIIEKAASGISLIQDLMVQSGIPVFPFVPRQYGSKLVRAQSATATVQGGRVLIPNWLPDLERVVDACVRYPNAGKDVVDTVSQAILYLRDNGISITGDTAAHGVEEYYEETLHDSQIWEYSL